MGINKLAAASALALGLSTAAVPPPTAMAEDEEVTLSCCREPSNELERRFGVPLNAEVIRIRLITSAKTEEDTNDIWDGKIKLPKQGYLKLEEDGKMRFMELAGFEGYYSVLTRLGAWIVYNKENKALVVVMRNGAALETTFLEGLTEEELKMARKAAEIMCECKQE